MPSSRKTRRDRGHARRAPHADPPPDVLMLLLMRLWAGDVLDLAGDGTLYLTANDEYPRVAIPVDVLDELEFARKWVRGVAPGERVRVTFRGAAALAEWLARRKPGATRAWNRFGDTLELRRG